MEEPEAAKNITEPENLNYTKFIYRSIIHCNCFNTKL